jgi:LacI family transcriptional regulator
MASVGFGDFPIAASLEPSVTVSDQDPAAVGKFVAERLFIRIADPTKRLRRRTVLPVSLTERDSCTEYVGRAIRQHHPGPVPQALTGRRGA